MKPADYAKVFRAAATGLYESCFPLHHPGGTWKANEHELAMYRAYAGIAGMFEKMAEAETPKSRGITLMDDDLKRIYEAGTKCGPETDPHVGGLRYVALHVMQGKGAASA